MINALSQDVIPMYLSISLRNTAIYPSTQNASFAVTLFRWLDVIHIVLILVTSFHLIGTGLTLSA
jgi:hypothetical protein